MKEKAGCERSADCLESAEEPREAKELPTTMVARKYYLKLAEVSGVKRGELHYYIGHHTCKLTIYSYCRCKDYMKGKEWYERPVT